MRKLPKFNKQNRMLLYICMAVFAVPSILNTELRFWTSETRFIYYALAGITLFLGIYHMVLDLHGLLSNKRSPKETSPFLRHFRDVPGTLSNILFALLNVILGAFYNSAWFGSLAIYYIFLTVVRASALEEGKVLEKLTGKERQEKEIAVYRKDSILTVMMSFALMGTVLVLVFLGGGHRYSGFVIYVVAAYTFYKIINATIQMIRIRKHQSPLLSIIKRIGFIDAWVSILILQTAMFAAFLFGDRSMERIMNAIVGGMTCVMALAVGIHGIWHAKRLKEDLEIGDEQRD